MVRQALIQCDMCNASGGAAYAHPRTAYAVCATCAKEDKMSSNSAFLELAAHARRMIEDKSPKEVAPSVPEPVAMGDLPPTPEEELKSLTCEHGEWADLCIEC